LNALIKRCALWYKDNFLKNNLCQDIAEQLAQLSHKDHMMCFVSWNLLNCCIAV